MKSLIISLVIAVAVTVGSIAYGAYMNGVSEELLSLNERLTELVGGGNFEEAALAAEEMSGYLDKKRASMAAADNHEVIEKIEVYLNELCGYIENGSGADALSRCRVLGYLYEHLPENYELRIENIL